MRIGRIALDISPLRASRDFRLLLAGRSVAMGGQSMAVAAANWQVYALTGSSLDVGLLPLATSAGMLTGLLTGGMLADRHDRRKIMLASRLPLGVLALLLMINSMLSRPALWAIYVIMLCMGLMNGLGSPSASAAVPALVGHRRLAAAAALNSMGGQLGVLGGPAIAGLLIAGPGLTWCFAMNALLFAGFGISVSFIGPLPPTVRAQRPGLRSMAEGFRYVRNNRIVTSLLLVDASAMIFGMPNALFPAITRTQFHGGGATFGLLTAAPALGALIGAATSGWTGRVRRPGLVVLVAGMVWGGAIVGFGFSGDLPVALVFLALAGMGDLVSEVLRNALLQHYTPDSLRGRVSSLYLAQVTTAPALGNAEAGTVAQLFTTTISVVSGGLACVGGALLLGLLIPALRHATLAGPGAQPGGPGQRTDEPGAADDPGAAGPAPAPA